MQQSCYRALYESLCGLVRNPLQDRGISDRDVLEKQRQNYRGVASALNFLKEIIEQARSTFKYGMKCHFFSNVKDPPLKNLRDYFIELLTKDFGLLNKLFDTTYQNLLRVKTGKHKNKRWEDYQTNIICKAQEISRLATELAYNESSIKYQERSKIQIQIFARKERECESRMAEQRQIIEHLKAINAEKDRRMELGSVKLMLDVKRLQQDSKPLKNRLIQANKTIQLLSVGQFDHERQIRLLRQMNRDLKHENIELEMRLQTFQKKQTQFRREIQQLYLTCPELRQLLQTNAEMETELTKLDEWIDKETRRAEEFLNPERPDANLGEKRGLYSRQQIIKQLNRQRDFYQLLQIDNRSSIRKYQHQFGYLSQKIFPKDSAGKEERQENSGLDT